MFAQPSGEAYRLSQAQAVGTINLGAADSGNLLLSMEADWLLDLLFAVVVVGTLVLIRLERIGDVLYTFVAVLLQLLGGIIFAAGLLGEGILAINKWVVSYLDFTGSLRVSLASLIILINVLFLVVRDRGPVARQFADFVGLGVCVILSFAAPVASVDLATLLSRADVSWLRVVFCVSGITLYFIGTRFLGRKDW
jgi:hypothetical protein